MFINQTLSASSQNLSGSFLLVLEQEYFEQKNHLLINICLFVSFYEVDDPVLIWKFIDKLFVSLVERINNRIQLDSCFALNQLIVFIQYIHSAQNLLIKVVVVT